MVRKGKSAMKTQIYDDFSSKKLDDGKWSILSFPSPDGSVWRYEEPNAEVEVCDGVLRITADPFTLKHDRIHMFDDPKHMYVSTRQFDLPKTGPVSFEVDMAIENYGCNADDLRDGFAAFNVLDLATAMVFDFIVTNTKIGVIYERLLVPNLTDEATAFTYLVEAPFVKVRNKPREFHNYRIEIDRGASRAVWYVDGKRFFRVDQLPVDVSKITIGMGLFTLKPPHPRLGSVSNHGQGASGYWRTFKTTSPP